MLAMWKVSGDNYYELYWRVIEYIWVQLEKEKRKKLLLLKNIQLLFVRGKIM